MSSLLKPTTQEAPLIDAAPEAVPSSNSTVMGMRQSLRSKAGWILIGVLLGASVAKFGRSPDASQADHPAVQTAEVIPPSPDVVDEQLEEELAQLHRSFETEYLPMIEGFKKSLASASLQDIEKYDAWIKKCDRLMSASAEKQTTQTSSFYQLGRKRREIELSWLRVQNFLDDEEYRRKRSATIPSIKVPEEVAVDE